MDNRYFKKANGLMFKYDPSNHDMESLKSRFKECDENGKEKKPKAKKKMPMRVVKLGKAFEGETKWQ